MLYGEVFVRECLRSVDTGRACSIAIQEVAALAHEIFDLRPSSHVSKAACVWAFISVSTWREKRRKVNERERWGGHTILWNLLPLYP